MSAQERIDAKNEEHRKRQEAADAGERQPEKLRVTEREAARRMKDED